MSSRQAPGIAIGMSTVSLPMAPASQRTRAVASSTKSVANTSPKFNGCEIGTVAEAANGDRNCSRRPKSPPLCQAVASTGTAPSGAAGDRAHTAYAKRTYGAPRTCTGKPLDAAMVRHAGDGDVSGNRVPPTRGAITMSWGRWLVPALASVLLAGCGSMRGFPEPPATSTVSFPNPGYQLADGAILKYNEETDLTKKKLLRNEIIDARMAEIDAKFADYERTLYREGIGVGVGTDWANLVLSAASTISRVESTKTIISAVGTATAGGAAAFDKRVLFDKTLPALLAQMVAQRETIRTVIRTNEMLSVEGFTLSAAESELQGFAFAGSVPGAIAGVAQDAGQKAANARQDQKDLAKAIFGRTTSTAALIQFWKPSGKVDAANEARIYKWLSDNGFDARPGAITVFLFDGSKEDSKAKAVKDLGLQ